MAVKAAKRGAAICEGTTRGSEQIGVCSAVVGVAHDVAGELRGLKDSEARCAEMADIVVDPGYRFDRSANGVGFRGASTDLKVFDPAGDAWPLRRAALAALRIREEI